MKTSISVIIGLSIILNGSNTKAQQDNCENTSSVIGGVYYKQHTATRKPVTYPNGGLVREANVMWSKRIWRRIDLREKINHPLYYPTSPTNDRKSLFDVIVCAILHEQIITAYDPGPLGDDDQFTLPMTIAQVEDLLHSVDSVPTIDMDSEETIMVAVENNITSEEVKQYELKEEWFFDKERSVMDVRIIGICPMVEVKDELTGEFRGFSPLFWIYFPEARHAFANAEVFNTHNIAQQISYDDLFWKRKFGSYIVKESNVYDRYIIEYKTGLQALLESERIKDELFIFEHDLWHY